MVRTIACVATALAAIQTVLVPTDSTRGDTLPDHDATTSAPTTIRGRYAPSPSGRFHLGNARTALLSWLDVRARGGQYVMRVEDLDPQRSKAEHERDQLADLRWLGLDWDEGPDVGGPHGPYRQSACHGRYADALASLATYGCTCTRRQIREATMVSPGAEPIYPGTCRHRAASDASAAVRWAVPPGQVTVSDRVFGPSTQDVAAEVGDFVLRRADGAWSYQLAVVLDDAAMQITDVMRGVDLLSSTPRQVWLQRALGLPTPRYAHVPLVVDDDGEKLGKRRGSPDLTTLRQGGADPDQLVARLARSCGLVGPTVKRVHPKALVDDFELSAVTARHGDRL